MKFNESGAYREAAGWLFWPALLAVLPKWLLKIRHHGGERRVFLRLIARAIRDGLAQRLDATHEEILALARTGPEPGPEPVDEGSKSGPEKG